MGWEAGEGVDAPGVVPWGSDPAPIPEPPALFLTLLTKEKKDNPNEIKKSD